jgi:epoxyqueuosine reductase
LCVSACPTGAISEDYVVDANRCISYQTIENRGEIPKDIKLDGWVFGCDVCQDVCPFNAPMHNVVTEEEGFFPKRELFLSPVEKEVWKSKPELEQITEAEFAEIFSDSPVKRTKFSGWKRNLATFVQE